MASRTDRTPKHQALGQTGTLNRRPDRVSDELFADSDFFDRNDLLQVKYEMLRRVRRGDFTARQAAKVFGFSRPSFYQAQEAFTRGGLGALVATQEGRRGTDELFPKVVEFAEQTIAASRRGKSAVGRKKRF